MLQCICMYMVVTYGLFYILQVSLNVAASVPAPIPVGPSPLQAGMSTTIVYNVDPLHGPNNHTLKFIKPAKVQAWLSPSLLMK